MISTEVKLWQFILLFFYLSTTIGQMLLNIQEGLTKEIVFSLGSVLVLISLILIAITKMKEPNIVPFERYSLPKLAIIAPLALLGGSFIAGFMVGGFFYNDSSLYS